MLDVKVKRTLPNIATKLNILYSTCTGNASYAILFRDTCFEVMKVRQFELSFSLNEI